MARHLKVKSESLLWSFMVCGEQLLAAELKEINMLLTVYSIFTIISLKEAIILSKILDLPFQCTTIVVSVRPAGVFCHIWFRPLWNTRSYNNAIFSLKRKALWNVNTYYCPRSWECCIHLFNLILIFNLENTIVFSFFFNRLDEQA